MKDPWLILKINSTKNKDLIRKAYRDLLKSTNPEDNQEQFMELKEAYDNALDYAKNHFENHTRNYSGNYNQKMQENALITPKSFVYQKKQAYSSMRNKENKQHWKKLTFKLFRHALNFSESRSIKFFRLAMDSNLLLNLKNRSEFESAIIDKILSLPVLPIYLVNEISNKFHWESDIENSENTLSRSFFARVNTARALVFIKTCYRENNIPKELKACKRLFQYFSLNTKRRFRCTRLYTSSIIGFMEKIQKQFPCANLFFFLDHNMKTDFLPTPLLDKQYVSGLSKKPSSKFIPRIKLLGAVLIIAVVSINVISEHALNVISKRDNLFDQALSLQNGTDVKKDVPRAIQIYKKLAEEGESSAQNNLGNIYLSGDYVKQNAKKAIYYYKLAAKQNNNVAQYNLGLVYQYGKGVSVDEQKALKYYKEADKNNYPEAKEKVEYYRIKNLKAKAYNLVKGIGVQKNIEGAIQIYKELASEGDLDSMLFLGKIYKSGNYVTQDYEKALHYFTLASSNGSLEGDLYSAYMYNQGLGTIKNGLESMSFLKKAAEKDSETAAKILRAFSITRYQFTDHYFRFAKAQLEKFLDDKAFETEVLPT